MGLENIREQLLSDGYTVLKNALPPVAIDSVIADIQDFLSGNYSINEPIQSPNFSSLMHSNPGLCTCVYDSLQSKYFHFSLYESSPLLKEVLFSVFEQPIVYSKAPLRIDVPYEAKEMTAWHQDYFHCRGSESFLSAYIPFSNLSYIDGALSLIPGSHKYGQLPHDVWGDTTSEYDWSGGNKRRFCSDALKHPSIIQELAKGDVLVFSGLLLHSTNINLGCKTNFNVNYRFSDSTDDHNPNMLAPILIK